MSQKIGLPTAVIVGMNAMIGAGIFAVPAALASNVGPAGLLTYAFVILAVWCMGQSLARLAQLFPEEGSFYTYASQWGGHKMGLIAAGSYLIGLVIAMGLLIQIIGSYLHQTIGLSSFSLGLITLVALVVLNMVGVHLSRLGQMILICCTVFPILATTIICITQGNISNFIPFMPYGLTNVFAATKTVIFGFFGFECAASLFTIVKNPKKNVPKALVYSIMLVGSLYMLFVGSIIYAVPLEYFNDPTVPLSAVLANIFPHHPWIISIIYFSMLSAMIGTVHSMLWSSGALLLSFLKQFKNPTVRLLTLSGMITQRITVLCIGIGIFLTFLTLGNIDLFFSFTAMFIVFAFTSSMITLLTVKKNWLSKDTIITIIGLLTALVIFYFAVEGIIINLF